MALINITGAHIIADLPSSLNSNFQYLEGLVGGTAKFVANLSGVTGQQTITHNLGSADVVVSIWDASGRLVFADTQIASENAITVNFEESFTGKVVVIA